MQTFKFIVSLLDGSSARELSVQRCTHAAATREAYRVAGELFEGYAVAVEYAW